MAPKGSWKATRVHRFNFREFAKFAITKGFHHHRITPELARANDEVESLMKLLNKTEQIALIKGENGSYVFTKY